MDTTPRANALNGVEWLRNSISIWSIAKNGEDKVNHPAVFPVALAERILRCWSAEPVLVLDPFLGSGTTLLACKKLGYPAIGFEIYSEFVSLARERVGYAENIQIIQDSIENAGKYLTKHSVEFVITSPPYWKILRRKRTADRKKERFYGENPLDLGNIEGYDQYLEKLTDIFVSLKEYLKPSALLFINVMDIRTGSKFYPLHSDLIQKLSTDFKLEDIIIWDRRKDYNNLKPLGYPYKFILNRVHEYILVFRNEV